MIQLYCIISVNGPKTQLEPGYAQVQNLILRVAPRFMRTSATPAWPGWKSGDGSVRADRLAQAWISCLGIGETFEEFESLAPNLDSIFSGRLRLLQQ